MGAALSTTNFESYIDKLFKASGYPGLSITVRSSSGIIFSKGFGKRSIEHDLPVLPDTVFGIASMSKSMTTFALAILEAEGRFSFDDPVIKYFPDFCVPGIPPECVTCRHLAMHTSGIPPIQPLEWSIAMNSNERDNEWSRRMRAESPNRMDRIEQIVEYISEGNYGIENYSTLGSPGEYMSYSNEGYALLSYIFDIAAGETLEAFLKRRVFAPLGMDRTVLDLDGSEAREIAKGNITSLFERNDNGVLVWDNDFSVLPPFRGCACVKSTSEDMTKYYTMLSSKGVWNGKQVFPERAVDILVGKGFPLRKIPFYCLGLRKRLIKDQVVCEHYGGLHGTSTGGAFIEGGYSVTVLCNEGGVEVDPFLWAGYNLVLGLPLETEHHMFDTLDSPAVFSAPHAITGDYVSAEGIPAHCIVTYENGELKSDYQGELCRLTYCGESRFVADSVKTGKRVTHMEFYIRSNTAWGVLCGSRVYQRNRSDSEKEQLK